MSGIAGGVLPGEDLPRWMDGTSTAALADLVYMQTLKFLASTLPVVQPTDPADKVSEFQRRLIQTTDPRELSLLHIELREYVAEGRNPHALLL